MTTTNLTQMEVARLEATIAGGGHKRAANKEKQLAKLAAAAFEKGISDEVLDAALNCGDFDKAQFALKAALNKSDVLTPPKSTPPAELPKKLKLGEMDEFGLGTSAKDAQCPHCKTNHIDNGYMIHEPKGDKHEKCSSRIYCCLGCGEEFGPKIRRNNSNGSVSPHRGSKVFISPDASNPYRNGSKSHAAFQFIQKNPNTKFEDLQALGVRIRTVTEMLRAGTARKAK